MKIRTVFDERRQLALQFDFDKAMCARFQVKWWPLYLALLVSGRKIKTWQHEANSYKDWLIKVIPNQLAMRTRTPTDQPGSYWCLWSVKAKCQHSTWLNFMFDTKSPDGFRQHVTNITLSSQRFLYCNSFNPKQNAISREHLGPWMQESLQKWSSWIPSLRDKSIQMQRFRCFR